MYHPSAVQEERGPRKVTRCLTSKVWHPLDPPSRQGSSSLPRPVPSSLIPHQGIPCHPSLLPLQPHPALPTLLSPLLKHPILPSLLSPLSSTEVLLHVLTKCCSHPILASLPPLIKISFVKTVWPPIFLLHAAISSLARSLAALGDRTTRMVTEHVMLLNLDREEVIMIETVLISKTGE